jgi:hypothetical protein
MCFNILRTTQQRGRGEEKELRGVECRVEEVEEGKRNRMGMA